MFFDNYIILFLRQGDPLSNYLFILYIEAYEKAERKRHLSHLLFANDSLLFCKVQKEECQTILRVLKKI